MKHQRSLYYTFHILSQITRIQAFLFPTPLKTKNNETFENWSKQEWIRYTSDILKSHEHKKLLKEAQQKIQTTTSAENLASFFYELTQETLENKIKFCVFGDNNYPKLLAEIPDRPLCLFYKGNLSLLKKDMIAIIGSRKASYKALEQSYKVAKILSKEKKVIVSGGAYGCDIIAHKGSYESKSKKYQTVVILSGGLMKLYPRGNQKDFLHFLENGGLLLSERLYYQSSKPYDFPIRNRIISGLCETTLVMDAAIKSGSMITAQRALDQGRNVLVLKPETEGNRSSGIQKLMEEGAKSFSNAQELKNLNLS